MLLLFQIGILMGVGWIFGFIASGSDVQALWWVFVIINSLHGPLLLVSVLYSDRFKEVVLKNSKNKEDTRPQRSMPMRQ